MVIFFKIGIIKERLNKNKNKLMLKIIISNNNIFLFIYSPIYSVWISSLFIHFFKFSHIIY